MNFTNLKRLAVFVEVVQSGSFAEAARRLMSSRSRVSEQIAELESSLGVRLLHRSTRALTLTEEGAKVFAESQSLSSVLDNVNAVVEQNEPKGRVTLSLNHDIAHRFVLPMLPSFYALHPSVKIDLVLDDEKSNLVSEGIDLAIRIGFSPDSAFIARVIHEEPFLLYASPELLRASGPIEDIQQALSLCWINTVQSNPTGIHRLRFQGSIHDILPTNYVSCNSPMAAQALAMNGIGICPLLPTTIRDHVESGKLIHILPEWQSDPLTFSLIYPSRKLLPQRTRVVIDYLLQNNPFKSTIGI